MADYVMNININLAGLLAELQRAVQRTINLVASGLETKQYVTGEYLRLPDTSFGITLDSKLKWSREQAQREYSKWVLSNGFRDMTEGAGLFLDSVHNILAYWDIGIRVRDQGPITMGDWDKMIIKGGASFHELGFPHKLDHLSKEHGLALNETFISKLLTINKTRNCLVHRQGVVSQKDVNCEGGLQTKWMKLALVMQDGETCKEVTLPFMAEKNTLVGVRNQEQAKVFPLGSQVEFTAQEFSDICWCFFIFGNSLKESVEAKGIDLGFLPKKEKQPEISKPEVPKLL